MNDVIRPSPHGSTVLADARWADPNDIAKRYKYDTGSIWIGRNPHNSSQAIGHRDDRHVFVCAETGGGKGRAFMVNNQLLWPGSLVSIGPKGDEATIAAPRRGNGDKYCDGLGQDVFILDPMRMCDVPETMRAHFNLLSALDANDGELVSKVDRIANAICRVPDTGDMQHWAREGKAYVANVILHVVTSTFFHDSERHILTVRDLILEGNVKGARAVLALRRQLAEEEGKPSKTVNVDPYEQLLEDMIANDHCGGAISRNARDLLSSLSKHVEGFESVRKSASAHVRFLEGLGISRTVAGPSAVKDAYVRTFKVDDLRGKRPISVFLTLPEQNYDPLDRWLRAMVQILLEGLQSRQGVPDSGERVLFCIDEFANLGKLDVVAKAANSLRSSGTKLMIATQRLGDLIETYGKAWEKFVASAGVQVWFGIEELETREYLEKKLGQREVPKLARSYGQSRSLAMGSTTSKSYTFTHSVGESLTTGDSNTRSDSHSTSTSQSESTSSGEQWQTSRSAGNSSGKDYGPHLFFEPWTHGSQRSRNTSSAKSEGGNRQHTTGGTTSEGNTTTTAKTTQRSQSQQRGESEARQAGSSESDTKTTGEEGGISEQFHIVPLLSANDARKLLLTPREIDHPAYPGLALVIVADEAHPFFVRKAYHDQDPFFVRKFHPNPAFPYIPLEQQPLLGWQITPDHFYTIRIPKPLRKEGLIVRILAEAGQRMEAGGALFETEAPSLDYLVLPHNRVDGVVRHAIDRPCKIVRSIVNDNADRGKPHRLIEVRFDTPIQREPGALELIDSQLWSTWLSNLSERQRIEEMTARALETARIREKRQLALEAIERELTSERVLQSAALAASKECAEELTNKKSVHREQTELRTQLHERCLKMEMRGTLPILLLWIGLALWSVLGATTTAYEPFRDMDDTPFLSRLLLGGWFGYLGAMLITAPLFLFQQKIGIWLARGSRNEIEVLTKKIATLEQEISALNDKRVSASASVAKHESRIHDLIAKRVELMG